MIRIDSFIEALKITWLRRYILQEHCTWNILSNFNIGLIYSMCDSYTISKIGEIKNPFWKDLLNMHFSKTIKIEKLEDILYSPIFWYNSKLIQGQNFFIKEWYDKGVRQIIDLLDAEGKFYQYNDLKKKYNVNGTFLDYLSLLRKLPREWENKIKENSNICQNLKLNVAQNCYT